jgi:ATP-binding cassette subfamily G (WHITE) protein 2 (PDR)
MECNTNPEKAMYGMSLPSSTTVVHEHKATEGVKNGLESSLDNDSVCDAEITELARRFTTESAAHVHQNPFEAELDSILDPKSPNFKPRA